MPLARFGISMPAFWLGIMLILAFGCRPLAAARDD